MEKQKPKVATMSDPSRSTLSRTANNGVASVSENNKTIDRKGKVEAATISEPSRKTVSRTANHGVASVSKPAATKDDQKGKAKVVPVSNPNATTILGKGKAKVEDSASSKPPVRIKTGKRGVGKGKNDAKEKSRTTTVEPPPPPPPVLAPVYHITWDGEFYRKTCEPVDQLCHVCEQGLSSWACDDDDHDDEVGWGDFLDEDLEYGYFKHMNPPDVAVLACGHSFHAQCLEGITPEDQISDPPCFVCFSVG